MDKMTNPANLARSLTTRINRKMSTTEGSGNGISRAFSMKRSEKIAPRPDISLPIELLSATNPLAFTAPDLPHINSDSIMTPDLKHLTTAASSSSLRSENSVPPLTSGASTTVTSGLSTPTDEPSEQQVQDLQSRLNSLPDSTSSSPASPKSQKSYNSSSTKSPIAEEKSGNTATTAPAVPQRAPSHTKKTHQALARQRSLSRVRSDTASSASATSSPVLASDSASRKSTASSRHQSSHSSKEPIIARNSADMFSARAHTSSTSIDASHPFSAELAKLTEVAEEFSPTRENAEQLPSPMTRASEDSVASSPSVPTMPSTPKTPTPVKPAMRKQKPVLEPTIWDEEQDYLHKHGLHTFSAEEYMAEIGSPYEQSFFGTAY